MIFGSAPNNEHHQGNFFGGVFIVIGYKSFL